MSGGRRVAGRALITLALIALVSIGLLGPNAAVPPLGPRGWAPGSLPWTPNSAAVTTLLAAAYLLAALGLALSLPARLPPSRVRFIPVESAIHTRRECDGPSRGLPLPLLGLLTLAVLAVHPLGSADHTNYAAYGRIALLGGDPWTQSPIDWRGGSDPVTSGVQPPWQQTPSIYGPLATLGQLLAAWAGGENLRQVVWIWQLLIVAAWLATRWLLRRLVPHRPGTIDLLWTANPLVVGTGVLGAHVDMLATPFMVAALLAARHVGWGAALTAGVAGGLAMGTKVTAGVVLLAVVAGMLLKARREPRGSVLGRCGAVVTGAALVMVPMQLWAGAHSYEQLGRSRRSISLATPWRRIYEWFGGHLSDELWRSIIFMMAALTCLVLAWLCLRLLPWRGGRRGEVALVLTVALSVAYAVGAPYVLPWYDQVVWALAPALPALAAPSARLVTGAWLTRTVVLALAYVPGRVVGMSARVEEVTLWWRTQVAPWGAALVWVALIVAARRRRRLHEEEEDKGSSPHGRDPGAAAGSAEPHPRLSEG